MRKILIGIIGLVGIIGMTGCANNGEITITKCKSYKNNICVAKEVEKVTKCNNPIKVGNQTYCSK